MYAFPKVEGDLSCDVAVVGAGTTGALIADELAGQKRSQTFFPVLSKIGGVDAHMFVASPDSVALPEPIVQESLT